MLPLKQSTAFAVPFFAHDANGDGVTGVADGSWTKRISKAGGAFGAMTVTISELENGWYVFTLSTSHTDTLGALAVSLSAAGAKRVNLLFRVQANLVDDVATTATAVEADTQDIQARLPAALVNGRMDSDAVAISGSTATADAVESNIANLDDAVSDAVAAPAAALTAYDPPTNAEMEARTLVAANYATAAGVSAVETDTQDIQNRLPAALVSGRMSSDAVAISGSTVAADAVEANIANLDDAVSDAVAAPATALTAYDPPTNAEMEARTLEAASYATAAGVSAVETDTQDIQSRLPAALVSGRMASDAVAVSGSTVAADALEANIANLDDAVSDAVAAPAAALTAYDPPTRAEATSDKDELLAGQATIAGYIDTEVAAILAAVDTEVASILAKTNNLPEGITKNAELANFMFTMVLASDHVTGATGLTVTAQRSIDGAALGACANAVSEIGNGLYKITLAASDLNGDTIALRFSAATADDTVFMIKTEAA